MNSEIFALQEKLGIQIGYFDSIDSTNLYCQRCLKEGLPLPDLVFSRHQSDGQGRVGKTFFSPKDKGLYMTFVFSREDVLCEDITPRVSLAVCRAIENVFNVQCGIKWVNDIYLSGRKIAGILCGRVEDKILIGIGINVEEADAIPEEIRNRYGAICKKCQKAKYSSLIVSLHTALQKSFVIPKNDVLEEFCNRCIHLRIPVQIEWNNIVIQGECAGIDSDFALLIRHEGRVDKFTSGFMTIK